MGNHRAERRPSRRSETPETPLATPYVGRRVAGRDAAAAEALAQAPVADAALTARQDDQPVELPPVLLPPVTVEIPTFAEDTAESLKPAAPGKRRAVKPAPRTRNPLIRVLPSMPVAVGLASLAVAVGGALVTTDDAPELVTASDRTVVPNAATGSIGSGSYDAVGRTQTLSRDSQRDALEDATSPEVVEEAEQQAEQRNAALGELAEQAELEAKEISLNRWVLPLDGYRLTATYGEYGLWATYHTGLDFAAPTGTPLKAIANGVITFAGSDGAYGYKTVLTLEDGTELWYCHQTSIAVSEGDVVRGGQVIGYVGSTGNTTGPHLHLEVRPGGGDPVDPYTALKFNGVTP